MAKSNCISLVQKSAFVDFDLMRAHPVFSDVLLACHRNQVGVWYDVETPHQHCSARETAEEFYESAADFIHANSTGIWSVSDFVDTSFSSFLRRYYFELEADKKTFIDNFLVLQKLKS